MNNPERAGRVPWNFIAIGLAAICSTFIASSAWERVKMKPPERTIEVTGSAKKRIVSDLIEWSANLETRNMDRSQAVRDLAAHVETTRKYLLKEGVKKNEIRVSSVSVEEEYDTEYAGVAEERIERQIFRGYHVYQMITVSSKDVALVERLSRESTMLLETGVPISSMSPSYYYTKLGELKIEMLAAAATDARERATNILSKAGGARIERLKSADMGVINVNPANSTGTSWDGNNDTSSLEKDIITIVHVVFELE